MKAAAFFCSAAIPFVILIILSFGLLRRVNVFDSFTAGAKDGLKTAVSIVAPVIALMVAIAMLRASGALDALASRAAARDEPDWAGRKPAPARTFAPRFGQRFDWDCNGNCRAVRPGQRGRKDGVRHGRRNGNDVLHAGGLFSAQSASKNARHTVAAALFADFASVVLCLIVCGFFF